MVLDLVRILPGFRESPGGNLLDTFAGLSASTLNTTRDGVSVTDGRFASGLFSTTNINPDLVGEVRCLREPPPPGTPTDLRSIQRATSLRRF